MYDVGEDGVEVDVDEVDAAEAAGELGHLLCKLPVVEQRQLVAVRGTLPPHSSGDHPLCWHAPYRRRPGHGDLPRAEANQCLMRSCVMFMYVRTRKRT